MAESKPAGYSGTPLGKKLGLKPEFRIALQAAPRGFRATLGKLPPGAKFVRGSGKLDVVLLFAKERAPLRQEFARWSKRIEPAGVLWVGWPKKSSGIASDLDFSIVQRTGLDAGLVDTKICAIDETWSGLKFVRRLKDR